MKPKIKNMNTPFKLGQIVRFKNYKRNELEKEAYFVVIEEKDDTNELVSRIKTNFIAIDDFLKREYEIQ